MKYRFILFAIIVFAASFSASAQRGDYMTPAEQDVVRNNQDIDARVAVLTYMIDRRFIAMGIDVKPSKPPIDPEDTWGPEPKGTKPELLGDIRHLLEKAIDDIDNLAGTRAEKTKEERKGVNLFNKAVKSLDASAKRWVPILKREYEKADDEHTHSAAASAVAFCEQIIEASAKLK
jgi:hypothetical protein